MGSRGASFVEGGGGKVCQGSITWQHVREGGRRKKLGHKMLDRYIGTEKERDRKKNPSLPPVKKCVLILSFSITFFSFLSFLPAKVVAFRQTWAGKNHFSPLTSTVVAEGLFLGKKNLEILFGSILYSSSSTFLTATAEIWHCRSDEGFRKFFFLSSGFADFQKYYFLL